jgi:DNA-binding MarR family transcriptional regulator
MRLKKETTDGSKHRPAHRRADKAAAAFEAHYLDYQYVFVEFLISHLIDASRAFDGDYQEMLVMAVLGQSRLAAVRSSATRNFTRLDVPPTAESTNATRISDITGIPRQTVRRKLASLEARGWITRDDAGAYRLFSVAGHSKARQDLSEPDRRAIERIARLYADLDAIIDRHHRS